MLRFEMKSSTVEHAASGLSGINPKFIRCSSSPTVPSAPLRDGEYDVTIEMEASRFGADAKEDEIAVAMHDWIDSGAFIKPDKQRKFDRTIYCDRVHISQARSCYSFTACELPDQAGVDPLPTGGATLIRESQGGPRGQEADLQCVQLLC